MVFRRRQPSVSPLASLSDPSVEFARDPGANGSAQPRLSKRVKRALQLTLASILVVSATDIAFMSRSFGAPADPLDDRTDVPTPVPVLSPRRVVDLIGEVGGAPAVVARANELFSNERMGSATASSCVVVRQAGRTIVSLGADRPVIPASTMKLITATAALDRLGAEAVLTTAVTATSVPSNGVLTGDLHLVGGGDPLLSTADYLATFERQPQAATSLEELADQVAALGFTRITGDLVGDDRLFDGQRSIPSWKESYLANGEVGPLSALAVNDGFARTVSKKKKNAKVLFKANDDPAGTAAVTFAALLAERGIALEGTARSVKADEVVATQQLATIASLPVNEIVGEMLTQSDNTTAEMLLKLISVDAGTKPGTTAGGLAAVKQVLTERRIDPAAFTLVDGSGLDRANKITCRALVQAIEAAPEELRTSLPVAGESGTLIERMLGDAVRGKVRAKTGTLNGVSALAGDIATRGGGRVEFAMVLNDLPAGVQGTATGDEMAIAIAGYPVYVPTQPTTTVPLSDPSSTVAQAQDDPATTRPTTVRVDTRPRPLDLELMAPPTIDQSLLPDGQ